MSLTKYISDIAMLPSDESKRSMTRNWHNRIQNRTLSRSCAVNGIQPVTESHAFPVVWVQNLLYCIRVERCQILDCNYHYTTLEDTRICRK